MKKIISIFVINAILFAACQQNNKVKTFVVTGTFLNAPSTKIFLAELPFNSTHRTIMDSGSIAKDGNFSLQTLYKGEGLYQLFVENGPGLMLINDADKIKLQADAKNIAAYKIEGGSANAHLQKMFADFLNADSLVILRRGEMDSLAKKKMNNKEKDSLTNLAKYNFENSIQKKQKIATDFIETETNGTAVYFALGMAKTSMQENDFIKLLQSSLKKFPAHPGLITLDLSAKKDTSVQK